MALMLPSRLMPLAAVPVSVATVSAIDPGSVIEPVLSSSSVAATVPRFTDPSSEILPALSVPTSSVPV